jgi:Protein of unknown function (DUF1826)
MSDTRPSLAAPAGLASRKPGPGPVSLLERSIEPAVAAALDSLDPGSLPNLRAGGSVDEVCGELCRELEESSWPAWLAGWLVEDVRFLAGLYRQAAGDSEILLRIETIGTDACRRFHADNVRLRLVTTYRGPGTQWISPHRLARLPAGGSVPADAIRQLGRGAVAILRGSRDATPEMPGVLHRSPPIAGTGITRLFLAIDEFVED